MVGFPFMLFMCFMVKKTGKKRFTMEGMKNMKRDKNKECSTIDTEPFVGAVRIFPLKPETSTSLFLIFMPFMCFMVKNILTLGEERES